MRGLGLVVVVVRCPGWIGKLWIRIIDPAGSHSCRLVEAKVDSTFPPARTAAKTKTGDLPAARACHVVHGPEQ